MARYGLLDGGTKSRPHTNSTVSIIQPKEVSTERYRTQKYGTTKILGSKNSLWSYNRDNKTIKRNVLTNKVMGNLLGLELNLGCRFILTGKEATVRKRRREFIGATPVMGSIESGPVWKEKRMSLKFARAERRNEVNKTVKT